MDDECLERYCIELREILNNADKTSMPDLIRQVRQMKNHNATLTKRIEDLTTQLSKAEMRVLFNTKTNKNMIADIDGMIEDLQTETSNCPNPKCRRCAINNALRQQLIYVLTLVPRDA